jgi:hypothetical protein
VIPGKALSVIYETSAFGVIDEFVQKFVTAKSMIHPFKRARGIRYAYQQIRTARKRDVARILEICNLIMEYKSLHEDHTIRKLMTDILTNCPTAITDSIRKYCWRKEWSDTEYLHQQEVPEAFTIWVNSFKGTKNMCYEHGPNDMYLGMHTDLKILPPTLSISGSSPALRRIEKLLKVYPLLRKLGPQVEKYIKKSLEELSGIPSTLWLNCVWMNISGSISHRVPANHWSPVVGLNELPTRSTYVSRKTSTDNVLKTMAGDWTINYGFLLAFALYQTEFQANQELDKQILYWMQLDHECEF